MPYSDAQMFALVGDVESYPAFMSGCSGAKILAQGDGFIKARLELSRAGFSQSFVTKNTLLPPKQMILQLVEGPFKSFEGVWQFDAMGSDACKVSLTLDFEFSNKLLGFAAGKIFKQIASDQVTSLRARADKLYNSVDT